MGIFSEIWDRITISPEERREHQARRTGGAAAAQRPAPTALTPAPVDVESVLERMAAKRVAGATGARPSSIF
jgi:hypothetical protein